VSNDKLTTALRVLKGTPKHGDSALCATCNHAQIIEGQAESQRVTLCGYTSERVRWPVVRCTMYDDKRIPPLREMKEIAWMLVTKKAGRDIGFMSAREFKQHQKEREDELEDIPE